MIMIMKTMKEKKKKMMINADIFALVPSDVAAVRALLSLVSGMSPWLSRAVRAARIHFPPAW